MARCAESTLDTVTRPKLVSSRRQKDGHLSYGYKVFCAGALRIFTPIGQKVLIEKVS